MRLTSNDLPLAKFFHWENHSANRVMLRQPGVLPGGDWKEYTWAEVGQEVRKLAGAIREKNLPPQSRIAILSKNCAHWIITDLAIWMSGHISVPLYPTFTADTIRQILEHSESKLLFVGKLDDWNSQKSLTSLGIPTIDYPDFKNEGCQSYDDFLGNASPMEGTPSTPMENISTIIYTSGTTGLPKGVVHTFQSLATAGILGNRTLELSQEDTFFSYLPLSHVAERLLIETCCVYSGGTISFVESLDTFAKNLAEVQPTIFLAVPRIWTKFKLGILGKLPQKKLDLLLSIPLVSHLIRKKVLTGLGLSNARWAVTGAAPISPDLLRWFKKLGLEIQEAYGMTENFAVSHVNRRGNTKPGTVGQAVDEVETQISEKGEILIRSDCNMQGYYKEPQITQETLQNGFLHTGDKGEIDSDGFLKITGRVKDLFKTGKGKYVAPSPIELKLSNSPLLEQVCVVGTGLPQPLGLVVLSEAGMAEEKGSLQAQLETLIQEVNQTLEAHEKLSSLVVMKDAWTVENNRITPTMKVKRNIIEKDFGAHLEPWSEQKAPILFEN